MAGGDVVTGIVFAPLGQGAQPAVAFREHGRVGGVGGMGGRDDRGAFLRHGGERLCLQHIAGVLAGVAAEHEPVIGRGVLAVIALDEPAAVHRQQPGVRVGDVALRRLRGFLPGPGIWRLPGFRGGLGLEPAVLPGGRGPYGPSYRCRDGPAGVREPGTRRRGAPASPRAWPPRQRRPSLAAAAARPAPPRSGAGRPPRCRPPAPPGRPALLPDGGFRGLPLCFQAFQAGQHPPDPRPRVGRVLAPCPHPAAGRCRAARPCPRPRPRRPSGRPRRPARPASAARPRPGWPPPTHSRRS
jgi:hypothetical protein